MGTHSAFVCGSVEQKEENLLGMTLLIIKIAVMVCMISKPVEAAIYKIECLLVLVASFRILILWLSCVIYCSFCCQMYTEVL